MCVPNATPSRPATSTPAPGSSSTSSPLQLLSAASLRAGLYRMYPKEPLSRLTIKSLSLHATLTTCKAHTVSHCKAPVSLGSAGLP